MVQHEATSQHRLAVAKSSSPSSTAIVKGKLVSNLVFNCPLPIIVIFGRVLSISTVIDPGALG